MSFLNLTRTRAGFAPRQRRLGLLDYLELYRQRRDLSALSPHQLRDIGVEPQAAKTEAQRAPWDVPQHWLR